MARMREEEISHGRNELMRHAMQLQVKAEMLILCEDMTSDHRPKIFKKIEEIPNVKERWFNWTTLRGISFIYHSFNKITCYVQIVSMIKWDVRQPPWSSWSWRSSCRRQVLGGILDGVGGDVSLVMIRDGILREGLAGAVGGNYGLAIDHGELMDMEQFELACVGRRRCR
ncbi:uncharacterized protein [Lolium perenne]|uniref:uncharacterized protein isoform X2 n=1 Tax=Lolium perenne TaxID=4522 RepID=UPI003A9A315D